MANIVLPAGIAVNLYAATGTAVGTQLQIQNVGSDDVRLATTQAELVTNHAVIAARETAVNNAGDAGAWAMCAAGGGVNARVI